MNQSPAIKLERDLNQSPAGDCVFTFLCPSRAGTAGTFGTFLRPRGFERFRSEHPDLELEVVSEPLFVNNDADSSEVPATGAGQ